MQFENFSLSTVVFGTFRLDGGAMFGSVPKNLWNQKIAADEENCIPLATRCLIIQDKDRKFLVDVGNGEKWGDKPRKIFKIRNYSFAELKFEPESITDIILTHLHFDHAGGISRYRTGSTTEVELVYPSARVFLQEANWKNARNPSLKERASYLPENVEILKDAKLELVRDEAEIYPGIFVHRVDGHTIGQQWIEVRGKERSVVFPTDLIPTSHHVPLAYHMGYDACASTLLQEKESFLSLAVERNWIVVFEHDPAVSAATIKRDERGGYMIGERVEI